MSSIMIENKYTMTTPKVAKKYIIIPKYGPLYAMAKCYAPTSGPIKTPIAIPVTIIGELLNQRIATPEIFEVMVIDKKTNKYSDPVKLTKENYMKSYNDIVSETKSSSKFKTDQFGTTVLDTTSMNDDIKIKDDKVDINISNEVQKDTKTLSDNTVKSNATVVNTSPTKISNNNSVNTKSEDKNKSNKK